MERLSVISSPAYGELGLTVIIRDIFQVAACYEEIRQNRSGIATHDLTDLFDLIKELRHEDGHIAVIIKLRGPVSG